MAVDGRVKKRTSLTALTIETINFAGEGYVDVISLAKNGDGNIAYKINGTITGIDDDEANILTDAVPFATENPVGYIRSLSVVSDADIELQWITRVIA